MSHEKQEQSSSIGRLADIAATALLAIMELDADIPVHELIRSINITVHGPGQFEVEIDSLECFDGEDWTAAMEERV